MYGRNPNGVNPLTGLSGRSNPPLQTTFDNQQVVSAPVPRKIGTGESEEDDSAYGPQDPNYETGQDTEEKPGFFSNMGKGDGDIIEDAGPDPDAMIYGSQDADDAIFGDDSITEGPDDDEIDAAIWGTNDPQDDVAGSALTDADIYGEPDEPPAPRRKKVVYRIAAPGQNRPSINPQTGLGSSKPFYG